MEKKTTSAVTIGLLVALVLIVYGLVVYFAKLYTEKWIQYPGTLIFCVAVIWAIINHGKENNNQVGFGGLFGFGFKITAVVTCLMIVYTILFGYIFPDVKETFIEQARIDAMKNPNADPGQIEQGIQMFAKNYNLFIILGLLFWYIVTGAITSLIGAAVTKKRPPQPFENSFNQ